jgi:hypothetical protein
VRQVLGAIAQFEKASNVAKLAAARKRKRECKGRCEGTKPLRESHLTVKRKRGSLRNSVPLAVDTPLHPLQDEHSLIASLGCYLSGLLYLRYQGEIVRPAHFTAMPKIAGSLAWREPFIRVDLYDVGRPIFCKLTLTPKASIGPFEPPEDEWLGSL